jgi:hypothetical protein
LIEQLVQTLPEDSDILIDEVGTVKVALLDDEDKCEVLLHHSQGNDFVLLLIVELDVGLAVAVVMPVFVVEIGYIDEYIEDIRADIIFALIGQLLVVVADVELGDQVEQVGLLDFGVVGEVVEEFADVGRAGDHLLEHLAEGLEDGGVVDGGEIELDLLDIYLVLADLLLEFEVILVPGVGLAQVNVCLIREDEDGAAARVLFLQVIVDIVEVIDGLHDI